MKINIIGSGWLAKPLATDFNLQGHNVTITTTQQDKAVSLKEHGFNALVYKVGDQLSNPAQLFDVDVLVIAITHKVIEDFDLLVDQLKHHKCHHVIYISSTSVYLNDGNCHDENSKRLNASNPLLSIEKLIHSLPFTSVIRFAGLVGPNRHPGKFFTPGRILKNPAAPVNLIHLVDCIGVISTVIEKNCWNETFNACADTHPTKIDFYSAMAERLNTDKPLFENNTSGSFKTINNHHLKSKLRYQLLHPDVMNFTF